MADRAPHCKTHKHNTLHKSYVVSVVSLLLLPARGGSLDELLAGLVVAAVQIALHNVHRLLMESQDKSVGTE